MAVVLAFARMIIEDKEILNEAPFTLNFDDPSQPNYNLVNRTEFTKKGYTIIGGKKFDTYKCKFSRKGKKTILVGGTKVKDYEIPVNFEAIKEVGTNIIYFKVRTPDANTFINKINSISDTPIFEKIEVDLLNIASKVHTVIGGWFRIPSADISSKSIHGANIYQSKEFEELSKLGNLTSLNVIYPYENKDFKIVISSRGSIYLSSKIEPKEQEIILLLDLFFRLII